MAKKINADGGFAEAAQVDALDEKAVEQHLKMVVEKVGRVDISFNAVGIPSTNNIGVPLAEMDVDLVLPADRDLHEIVLSNRAHGRQAHGCE